MTGKRLFSLLLALVLCIGLLPPNAQAATATHKHPCCGAICDHSSKHYNKYYSAWSGGSFSGSYVYLKDDATLNTNFHFSGTVYLCLNGHTLTLGENVSLNVDSGSTLIICDCKGTGKIVSESEGGDSIIQNYNGGSLYIYDGSYRADQAEGVNCYIENFGNMYVYGGQFSICLDNWENANAEIYGGVFENNAFDIELGNYGGNMTIYDVTINGGGIYNANVAQSGQENVLREH